MTLSGVQATNMSEERPRPTGGVLPLRLLQAIALLFLAAKLVMFAVQRPFMDETYYFLWGQHPALSYYDHPSLVGWTEGISGALFGWTIFALRLPVLLTLIGDLVLLYLFARRSSGANWREPFWMSAALFLSMPLLAALTGTALPDHLLIFMCLGALHFMQGFLATVDAGAPRWRWLYAGAAMAGLAILCKYYGALVGAGFLAALLVTPRYRPLFRSAQLYLAIALALAFLLPVVIWNAQNGFASFAFIFASRQGAAHWWTFGGTPGYLVSIVLALSPFLVWPALRFGMDRSSPTSRPAQAITVLSTLLFFAVSTVTNTIIHWNALAYVAAVPFLGSFIRSRSLAVAHFIYGALFFALIIFNYSVMPLVVAIGHGDDASSSSGYGVSEVAAQVASLKAETQADFVAGTDYSNASELAFALHDRDVVSLSEKTEAFDFWTDYTALAGKTAIVVTDPWHPLTSAMRAEFASVDPAGTVDVTSFGKFIARYTLYVARDFHAQP